MIKTVLQFISDFVYLYPLLMSFVWSVGGLIFFWKQERGRHVPEEIAEYPVFSILVPCHNEEDQIEETVSHLQDIDYPRYEIILIDDGSIDATASKIHTLCEKHDRVRGIYFRNNEGKASALNAGCIAANGELIMSVDADALLDRNVLKWMAWHFVKFPRVGAVTGNPRVINRTTLLGKIQTGEYATIIGLIKRAQRILGKVLTVSGVVAAFRKDALASVGFWDTDMVTEDIDVTWKLEKKFWDVRYEPRAICWVFVAESIRGLWRQRLRWAQGGVEVLRKHRDIWHQWKQRRLWPVYLEYIFSSIWAYSFWTLVVLWAIQASLKIFMPIILVPPIPPLWTGSVLASVCLIQFVVCIYIDNFYDKKLFKYLFWVIWYPFIYWMISALALVFAFPKAFLKKKGTSATWISPDRGIEKFGEVK